MEVICYMISKLVHKLGNSLKYIALRDLYKVWFSKLKNPKKWPSRGLWGDLVKGFRTKFVRKILKKETAFEVDFGVTNLPHLHHTMSVFSVSEFRFQTPGYLLGSEPRPEPPNLSRRVPAAGEPKWPCFWYRVGAIWPETTIIENGIIWVRSPTYASDGVFDSKWAILSQYHTQYQYSYWVALSRYL